MLPPEVGTGPRVVFYPGSSIGNFTPAEALAFLRQAREVSQGGALLIGVDLVKPVSVLEPAYDDALGVTAAFNRNMLLHLNRLLGSNFDIAHWRHRARFDTEQSRIEMYLDAMQDQLVQWPGGERLFRRGEAIHTENSYKYSVPGFEALLSEAGFAQIRCWTDPQNWFAVFTAQAALIWRCRQRKVMIVSPALAQANNGNWQTAWRWSRMLRPDFSTQIASQWDGEEADVLIALHARRSAVSVQRWAQARGAQGLAVVLTGTDLYRDIQTDASAQRSLQLAGRLVVLQELRAHGACLRPSVPRPGDVPVGAQAPRPCPRRRATCAP